MEAFLSALDITGSPHQQRVITIATTPAMGALLMLGGQRAEADLPQILLHNIAIVDAARQLDQRRWICSLIPTCTAAGDKPSCAVSGSGTDVLPRRASRAGRSAG